VGDRKRRWGETGVARGVEKGKIKRRNEETGKGKQTRNPGEKDSQIKR